ncbi:MAG TPA: peptidylprolyl isomerase [Candidatus Eisenbacteria bacterium]
MLGTKATAIGIVAAVGLIVAVSAFAADPPAKKTAAAAKKATSAATDSVAVLETSKGRMVVAFWDKEAPQTAKNFRDLADKHFFDGTGFHRIIKGFMIQGGDPKSKNPKAPDLGTGDPGYKIKDEFNSHPHVKGVISMANSGTPNSAGSQFFIVDGDQQFLDGKYTAFGHLIQGMDVLDAIAGVPVGPNLAMGNERSKPLEWVTLKSVKIVAHADLASMGKAAVQGKTTAAKAAGQDKAAAAKAAAAEKAAAEKKAADAKAAEAKAAAEKKAEEAKAAAQPPAQPPPTDATQAPAGSGAAPDTSAGK